MFDEDLTHRYDTHLTAPDFFSVSDERHRHRVRQDRTFEKLGPILANDITADSGKVVDFAEILNPILVVSGYLPCHLL